METCDLCGAEMDDWMVCPDCDNRICRTCIDHLLGDGPSYDECFCGCPFEDFEEEPE